MQGDIRVVNKVDVSVQEESWVTGVAAAWIANSVGAASTNYSDAE
jgi:hypothetical protein